MKTEKDKMLSGDLYNPHDPQLSDQRRHARLLIKNSTIAGPIKLASVRASLKNSYPLQERVSGSSRLSIATMGAILH